MSFQGNLQSLGLFDVFQNVHQNRKTGTLVVRSERSERFVHFDDGLVHLVSYGRGRGLPIRDYLLKRGYVAKTDLEKALRARGRSRAALRSFLAKLGILSEEDFSAAMQERVEDFLYELLGVREAQFEFEEGKPPSGIFDLEQKSLGLRLDPAPIVMEAARRDDEWGRIRKVVQSDRDLFVRLGEEAPEDDPDMQMVWSVLDGQTELREFGQELPLNDFEVQSIVAELVEAGLARAVHPADIPSLARQAIETDDYERARVLLEHAVEIERGDHELRRMLAETYEQQNRLKDAAAAWAVLGYQESMDGDDAEALNAYQRAVALDPVDVGLRERCFEILGRVGTTGEVLESAIDVSQGFFELGLFDRAVETLELAMQRPDLAKRPGLLGRIARIEKDSGQPQRGFERMLSEALQAEESGERELAEAFYLEAQRVFPEKGELRQRLADLRSHKRERQRRARRRRMFLAAAVLLCSLLSLALVEELRFSLELGAVLRSSASAVLEGRGTEAIQAAWRVRDAHPFSPTRASVDQLVLGLVDAEILRLERERSSGRLLSAKHGYQRLQNVVADRIEVPGLGARALRVQRQKRVFDALQPWFLGHEELGRDPATLIFERADADQVLSLYARLCGRGRELVRVRLTELKVAGVLPLIVDRYLDGDRSPLVIDGKQLSTELAISTLAGLIDRNDAKEHLALTEAFGSVLDEFYDDRGRKALARSLLPCFVELEGEPPAQREKLEAMLP